ncbi:MAG TPA: cupin domain-containing protein [Acidimicrobiales bacterium]|nr:cupin domain-containing protein [Acidimicrobiales bacterium]
MPEAFDLSTTFIHLGLGAKATPLPEFEWSASYLEGYERRFASDGVEGRLVIVSPQVETWDSWERHPAGEEVVVLLSGRVDLVQELDGQTVTTPLRPGEAIINPTGVWHRSVVHEPGSALFITPGLGTEHRPLEGAASE